MRNILFVTATVTPPPGAHDLARSDPSDRLGDYRTALRFYCHLLRKGVLDALVMAENSNADPEPLMTVAREHGVLDRCEFITCENVSYVGSGSLSRFYGEISLMKYGLEHSHVLRADPDAVVWKVTGRYMIRNLEPIIRDQPPRFDLYVNCRNYPARWVDSYVVGLRAPAFLRTIGANPEEYAATSPSGEYLLRRRIDEGRFPDLLIIKRFNRVPRVIGIRGADGANYQGLRLTIKHYIRVAMNFVFPWVWV